jgi:hypothetical protein
MTSSTRHDRTVRLLEGRLEGIAQTAERMRRSGRDPELEVSLARVAAATRNAVQLELITPGEAEAIWRTAAERHPSVGIDGARPPRAA